MKTIKTILLVLLVSTTMVSCGETRKEKNTYEIDYAIFLPNGESIVYTETVETCKAPEIRLNSRRGSNHLYIERKCIASTTAPIILLDTRKIK